jgi:hypothetical protein
LPTSGTHITVLQRLALEHPSLQALIGDPAAVGEDSAAGLKTRYANLGALGPDIFYAMADYGSDLQDLEDFLVKVAGTFQCISEVMKAVDTTIDNIASSATLGISNYVQETSGLLSAVISNGFLALMVDAGYNFWPVFEPARQKDQPREKWFWADYLHYIRTGKFTRRLLANAKANNNPNLIAYAYGYLTHYVTDVLGHPYVNQVVQGPWRLHWQRHHLVENFIDAYVWDRWHKSQAESSSDPEPPLDKVTSSPNSLGAGAPYSYARLNDHVNVDLPSFPDPVDAIVQQICDAIANGLFSIGIAVNLNPAAPTQADFTAWTELVAGTIRDVYDDAHPMNLAPSRPDGYPSPEDVGAAYGVFRLLLKIGTEDRIKEPQMPEIEADISAAVQDLEDKLKDDLAAFPPFPSPSSNGSVSFANICQALQDTLDWINDVFEAALTTIADFVMETLSLALTAAVDATKYALYLLNKALYSLYRTLRFALVQVGYATPYTEELAVAINSTFNTQELWRSKGDPTPGLYPSEELDQQRSYVFSLYHPFVPPRVMTGKVEQPYAQLAAPYQPSSLGGLTLPNDFIDGPLGPNDMFKVAPGHGPVPAAAEDGLTTFAPVNGTNVDTRNFGGALANCVHAFSLAQEGFPAPFDLPDYNLDGDRGYGWPTWDVNPMPTGEPPPNPFAANPHAGDPLNPTNPANTGDVARVNAVLVTG